jgi:hypothetical protein
MEVIFQLHAIVTLKRGKGLGYPFDRRLTGAQSRSGFYGEEKNHFVLQGIDTWPFSP